MIKLVAVAALFIASSSVAMADDKVVLPNYVALDYNELGHHPVLTPEQVARIQQVLARVKPCQRPLVRYAIDRYEKDGIALFFGVYPNTFMHVFGSPDAYYLPSMGVFAGPPDNADIEAQTKQGIQWDIDHQPCPK